MQVNKCSNTMQRRETPYNWYTAKRHEILINKKRKKEKTFTHIHQREQQQSSSKQANKGFNMSMKKKYE